jgi:hypothetical protein
VGLIRGKCTPFARSPQRRQLVELLDRRRRRDEDQLLDEAVERFRAKGIEPVGRLEIAQARQAVYDPRETFGIPIVVNEYP